jgi:arylsulfatase A-like enzyme
MLTRSLLAAALVILAAGGTGSQPPSVQTPDRLTLVFVIDGLRPDSINERDTPTLHRLRREGVSYPNSHAVFPTMTRVNAAALATGAYPGTNGIVGNDMYVAGMNPTRSFATGDYRELLRLGQVSGGRILLAKTLSETLHERGRRFVGLSSATPGSALILSPRAPEGIGIAIHGYLERGTLAGFPKDQSAAILDRLGPPPEPDTPMEAAQVRWTDDVLREYVLPVLTPDVVVDWIAAPDGAQHSFGVGSLQAREALSASDGSIDRTLKKVESLGLLGRTNVIVTSDHGFARNAAAVNVGQELRTAGLKASDDSDDVIVAANGPAILLYIRRDERAHTERVVRFLQAQDWADVIFTAPKGGSDFEGWVPGTFSLDLVRLRNPVRGPDVAFTLGWSSAPNAYGVEGAHSTASTSRTGPLQGEGGGHGGLNPWVVRNTLILWGPAFKRSTTIGAAAGIVDVTPTILAIEGIGDVPGLDGRVLTEALAGASGAPPGNQTRTLTTSAGVYRASIQVTRVGRHEYVDQAERIRP